MKKWLMATFIVLLLVTPLFAAVNTILGNYEIGQVLPIPDSPIYLGRNTNGALILWFSVSVIPGNYVLVPKIGTMWVFTWHGVVYSLVPDNNSNIRLERRK